MAAPTIGRRPFKPARPRVDWGHPLAQDLKSFILVGEVDDVVRGPATITLVNNPAHVSTPYGKGLNFSGSAQAINIGRPLAAGPWTLMAVFRINSTLNGAGPGLFAEAYPPSSSNVCHLLSISAIDATSPSIVQGGYFNGGWCLIDGPTLTVGRWYNIICTFAGNGGTLNLYYDGLRKATGTGSGTDPTPNEDTYIARDYNASVYLPGDIAVTGMWQRALTANEVATLYGDPYAMLRY